MRRTFSVDVGTLSGGECRFDHSLALGARFDPREVRREAALDGERDELRQENADLTEKINQLEVALGQLLKECKYLQSELVKKVTQEAAQQGA